MIKRNSHGFTLIEAIVSFAILAIAGTMIIVAVANMTNIFAEASLIKDTTNTLYENISKNENISDDATSNNITFNGDINIAGKMIYDQESINYGELFTIKLSQFQPTVVAEKLPEEIIEEVGLKARFYIAKSMVDIPQSKEHFQTSSGNYIPIGTNPAGDIFENAIKESCRFNFYKIDVLPSLLSIPNDTLMSSAYSKLDKNYQAFLDKQYKVKWFYAASGFTDDIVKVYGYFEPSIPGPGICIKYGDTFEWLPISLGIDEITKRLELNSSVTWYDIISHLPAGNDKEVNKQHLIEFIKKVIANPSQYSDIIYIEANMKKN